MPRIVWVIVPWIAMTGASRASDLAPFLNGAARMPAGPLVSDSDGNAFVPLPQWPATVRPPAKVSSAADLPSARTIHHAVAEKAPPTERSGRHAETGKRAPVRCREHVALKPATPVQREVAGGATERHGSTASAPKAAR